MAKSCFFYLAIILFLIGCSKEPMNADYEVVPLPQSIVKTDGEGFILKGSTKIYYPKENEVQKQTAEFLAEYIKLSTGLTLAITDQDVSDNVIILKADYKAEKPESYNLIVDSKQIIINGSDEAGTFYGVQTLRKSMPVDGTNKEVVFPAVSIEDFPRFGYRGMMLDVARHTKSLEFIKKYIDILALHNINKFHWHLTDDQGWRIEIKKYPELTKIGSQRAQTVIKKNSGEFDGKPYGGFFTQEEAKEVVEYAKKRFITVIPEVDLPGHMLAALAAYPNLGCTGGPYKVGEQWGVFDDVLCAGNEDIYTFLEGVFSEIVEIFPSEYVHIGGDESPKTRWKVCPKCQAKIKELKLTSDAKHSKEDKLQSYVMTYVEKFLNSKGRRIIGWDEILEGGLAPDATVMSWRGMSGGIEAAKLHHDVIMTPTSNLYFDYYQTTDIQNEPFGIGGYVPVQKVYELEPVPSELTKEEQKYIIGVQANLWCEYIVTPEHAEYMTMPRIAALSEVQWTMPEKKNYEKFLPRLTKLMDLYQRLGYNYATHIMAIASQIEPDISSGTIKISLFTYDNAPIYYTLDGSEPTDKSVKYEQPLSIDSSVYLRAVAYRGSEKSKEYDNKFDFNKATLKDIKLENSPHKNYTFKGPVLLVDGKRAVGGFASGEWIGFEGSDFVATIDLKEATDISKVITGTYEEPMSWVFGATQYTVAISEDGKIYKQVYDKKISVLDKNSVIRTVDLVAEFPTTKARFVKVIAKNTGKIPDWHEGKGSLAYLFVDEIIIE